MIEVSGGRREATMSPSAPQWRELDAGADVRARSPWQRQEIACAGIEMREAQDADVHTPDPVCDFFETDIMSGQRAAQKEDVLVPGDAAIGADAADLEVPRVLKPRQACGQ